uniref:Endophilin-A n=1 Tax=Romanomermis culicivorax TaxID=13658 RepID=A0A915II00_ROMCU
SLEILWDEYLQKLNDDALTPLNFYCNQFADLKVKIAKRGRKLVDYDAARHAHNSVVAANKKEDSKLIKTKEQFNIAKKLYTDINNELLSVLPNLYESRVGFTVNHLKCVFNADYHFHDESAKLSRDIRQEMGRMNVDDYKLDTNVAQIINNSKASEVTILEESLKSSTPDKSTSEEVEKIINRENGSSDAKVTDQLSSAVVGADRPFPQNNETKPQISAKQRTPSLDESNPFKHDQNLQNLPQKVEVKTKEEVITLTTSEKPSESISPVVLYKVRTTHRYSAEDTDELSFEAGEVILVVPYENPDEQDDGWLNGVKESSGEKGVFPENFTKKI